METTNLTAVLITILNTAIIYILTKTTVFSWKKLYIKDVTDVDYDFYMFIFLISISLITANTLSFYTTIRTYFILKVSMPEEISIGRYADRISMLTAYISFDLFSRKCIPKWFKIIKKEVK